ncbi:HNH endonuclease [Streptomyces sp. NPDC058232]|uniref:HNH endonuclease n=1 Tax=Streptomyces sp. NPDC058232 TaxID=3346393 RepID=UPI0036E7B5B6
MAEFTYPGGARASRCRPCLNAVAKERYAMDPERVREISRSYRQRNLDACQARKRAHYHGNKAYYAAKNARWVKDNPEANRARRARYRARKAAAPGGGVKLADWIALRDSYGCCIACLRVDVALELDHVIPLALGGRDHIDNIQPLCRSCNSSKKTRCTDYRTYFTDDLIGQLA